MTGGRMLGGGFLLWLGIAGPALAQPKAVGPEPIGAITRHDPTFDALVPADAKLERIATGFEWSEGPVWSKKGQFLLFSDIPNNAVMKWMDGEGLSRHLKPSGYTGSAPRGGETGSNGLLFDAEGRLVLCQHGDRRVARLGDDGSFATLADRFEGKRFNSPNDAVFKSNGDLYFTDPPYGLEKGIEDPARELDFQGVYRLSKEGALSLVTRELTRPNGIGFSPDEKVLYVANSDPEKAVWMAFDVQPDGSVANGRVFFDATPWVKEMKKGLPDGLKVDQAGNIFATGPGGIHVFSPQGKLLGTIDPGEATANCAFGGPDGTTLYVASDMNLCRIKLTTKGLGF